jgi:hypothetical protein
VFIELSGNLPRICTPNEVKDITNEIINQIQSCKIVLDRIDTYVLPISNLLPTIAGWLLDYPCVYKTGLSLLEDLVSVGDALVKFSIVAEIASVYFSKSTVASAYRYLDIMEFSVPLSLFLEDSLFEQLMTHTVTEKTSKLKCKLQEDNVTSNSGSVIVLSDVSFTKSIHQISQRIVL